MITMRNKNKTTFISGYILGTVAKTLYKINNYLQKPAITGTAAN